MADRVSDENQAGGVSGSTESKEAVVSRDAYDKLLGQRKADQAKIRDMEARLGTIEAEKAAAAEAALAEQGKFKEMFESEKQRRADLEASLTEFKQNDIIRRKTDALKSSIGDVLKDEYLRFADFNKIELSEDGSIIPETVQAVAEAFKIEHPHLIRPIKDLPSDSGSSGGPKKLSYKDWLALPASEQRRRMAEVED